MGRRKYPLIHLEGVQIKSKKKLRLLCKCINTLEEELGIKEVEISFKNVFVCPWIDLTQFSNSNDPMEKLIGGILIELDIQRHGDKSQYVSVQREGSEEDHYKIKSQENA